jgi:hypothetical protein
MEQARRDICALAVMAKAPRNGEVKTRLVPPLHVEEAAQLSACFLRDITANFTAAGKTVPVAGFIAYSPPGSEASSRDLVQPEIRLLPPRRIEGTVIIRRRLKRRYVLAFFQKLAPCLVGLEACASSHHWSRELTALGHTVRLMPPAYVKPYIKRQKNDAADAEAICEAVMRPTMRFVETKTPEQQSCLMLHRTRHLFIRQQTAVINSIRAHLASSGLSRRSAAMASSSGSMSLPIPVTRASPKLRARVWLPSVPSCGC